MNAADMNSMVSAMSTMTMTDMATSTGNAPSSMSTGMSSMGGMGGMGGMDTSCKVSMLWNWNTIGSCFISHSWHVRSNGAFAGSCIGTVLLVICLEFLRRLGREYDGFIMRRALIRRMYATGVSTNASKQTTEANLQALISGWGDGGRKDNSNDLATNDLITPMTGSTPAESSTENPACHKVPGQEVADNSIAQQKIQKLKSEPYRPSPVEQVLRALLHMLQFAVAYFVMLLAMYYNGYIIICIFIGAFLGSLIFSWEPISLNKENDATTVTKCCG